MKYIVMIGYSKFTFDDGATAVSFAELAVAKFTPSTYHENIEVEITIKEDESDD